MNKIEKMVFVATLPRSGSSMDCGILEACGAFGGKTIGCVPANPRGIFENRVLNSMCLSPIFDELSTRLPKTLYMFHKSGGPPRELFEWFNRDITYGMNRQGYSGGVAYFKNGIHTFLFDRINEAFPDAIWVLPNRSDEGVMFSHKRIYKDKPEDVIKKEIDVYRNMYKHILQTIPDRAFMIDNDRLVAGDTAQMKELISTLGLEWNDEAVSQWIDRKIWGDVPGKEDFEVAKKNAKGKGFAGNNGRAAR